MSTRRSRWALSTMKKRVTKREEDRPRARQKEEATKKCGRETGKGEESGVEERDRKTGREKKEAS